MMLRMRPVPSALLLLLLVCLTASQLPSPSTLRFLSCRNRCWHSREATNNNKNITESTHSLKTTPEKEDAAEELKREMQDLEAKAEEELQDKWTRMNETIPEKVKILGNTRIRAVEMEKAALEKTVTLYAPRIISNLTLENQKLVSDFALRLEEQVARCTEEMKEIDN